MKKWSNLVHDCCFFFFFFVDVLQRVTSFWLYFVLIVWESPPRLLIVLSVDVWSKFQIIFFLSVFVDTFFRFRSCCFDLHTKFRSYHMIGFRFVLSENAAPSASMKCVCSASAHARTIKYLLMRFFSSIILSQALDQRCVKMHEMRSQMTAR